MTLDETHDPTVRSWLPAANLHGCAFPIQNLPFAIFRRNRAGDGFRGGVAIGDQIIDLRALGEENLFKAEAAEGVRAGASDSLNALMQMGRGVSRAVRRALFDALAHGSALESSLEKCLVPQSEAVYALPANIGDYTDFYISIHHATAIGRLFRPDNPLLPNYKWIPIGYHGRSSSIGVSGQSSRVRAGRRRSGNGMRPQRRRQRKAGLRAGSGYFHRRR